MASQPFYVICLHVVNGRFNAMSVAGQEYRKNPARNSLAAFYYIRKRYGMRGFFRGLLPTALYTVIVLWDSLVAPLLSEGD